jgi:hypothetical protein
MSASALRTRDQIIYLVSHSFRDYYYRPARSGEYKPVQLPTYPSEAALPSESFIEETKRRLKHSEDSQLRASRSSEGVVNERHQYRWLWMFALIVTSGVIILGLVIGYLKPSPLTGAILPVGLAMWWGLYKLADRLERSN